MLAHGLAEEILIALKAHVHLKVHSQHQQKLRGRLMLRTYKRQRFVARSCRVAPVEQYHSTWDH